MLDNNIKTNDVETLKDTYNKQLNHLNTEITNLNEELQSANKELQLANKKIQELSLFFAMGKARTFSKKQEKIDEERNESF